MEYHTALRLGVTAEELERDIENMKNEGFDQSTVPMLALRRMGLLEHCTKGNIATCFKLALKIYYAIEPVQVPKIPPYLHLDSLQFLLSVVDCIIGQRPCPVVDPLPDDIKAIVIKIAFSLWYKLVEETAKCFGKNSVTAQADDFDFWTVNQSVQQDAIHVGFDPASVAPVSWTHCEDEKRFYMESMKNLLAWAEIDGIRVEEIL